MKRNCQSTLDCYVISPREKSNNPSKRLKGESSIFVSCPLCDRSVLPDFINDHIDNNCGNRTKAIKLNEEHIQSQNPFHIFMDCPLTKLYFSFDIIPSKELPGLYSISEFMTELEEAELISALDNDLNNPWSTSHFNGIQLTKKWGVITDYNTRKVRQNNIDNNEFPFPSYLSFLLHRIEILKQNGFELLKSINFIPNEGNSMCYIRSAKHYLKAHFDDRYLSGPILINISLQCDSYMTFRREKPIHNAHTVKVLMKRRSMHIVSKQSRYEYTHSIDNSDIYGDRRLSIVFRQAGS
mmetsp:Transcript_10318/g.10389  ORF Transcript_10318/g.10389 Transcript_10318/m.10389 type:complete len:296 (+) Transcript_10318:240-1127(+)